ncbi:MAG TPA: TonB-dependent receptor [Vicinamibacterales bacterium]|nr:TonB-dependent receptor [Vicinamibacterales bacterium]
MACRIPRLVALLGMLTLSAAPAFSQASSGVDMLTVTVRDNWGVIPGAVIRAAHRETQTVVRTVTDGRGVGVLTGLRPGTHDLRVEFGGFADHVQEITVAEGQSRTLDVTLTLPQFSTTITVSTANRREEVLLNMAEPTTLIDKGQIDDTGARTARDVLVEQAGSGVTVHAGGGQGHVSINGIPNSGVLVLMDGRRVIGRDGIGNFNLEDLDLTGVERIEVVKGAGSALYGSDALGGVVNIISKKSSQPGLTNTFTFTGGSYSDVRASDTLGYRVTRGGATLAAGYRTFDGYDLSESNPQTIGQPESTFKNVALNSDYRFADRLVTRLFVQRIDRNIRNYFFSGATQLGGVYNNPRDITRLTVSPEADVLVRPNTTFTVSYAYGKYDRQEKQIYPSTTIDVPWQEWNRELKLVGRHQWNLFRREHNLQGGFERRDEKMDRPNLRLPGTTSRTTTRDVNTFWLQQEFNVTGRLTVTGGFRYDDYSDFGQEVSPKVGAVYALTDVQRIRATFGHGFRAPSFGELYLYTPPSFVGNPDLEPEISNTVTVGYTAANARVQAAVDVFHAQIENGITFDLSRLPFTYTNLTETSSFGTNTSFAINLPYGFSPSVAYTFVQREDANGAVIGGLPRHTTFLKLLWTNARLGLRANLRAQMLDRTVSSTDGSYVPAYRIWHLQGSKKLRAKGAYGINVFAQIDNLSNRKDILRRNREGEPIAGDFQVWLAPRTFLAGITVDMDWAQSK